MRHVGRDNSPRHASCADACPTGNPTVRLATASASVWSIFRCQPARKWYPAIARRRIAPNNSPRFAVASAAHNTPSPRMAYSAPAMRRRRMSGKTYGPTYAVASRSSGSASPGGSSGSSGTATNLPGPGREQLVVAGAQALRQHPGLGDRGHEVRVAGPPGQHVHMQVPGHTRPGRPPEVGTDVGAVRRVRGLDRLQRAHLRPCQRDILVVGQVDVARDVTDRRDHQVPGPVREQVHHGDRRVGAFEHEGFGVVGRVHEVVDHATVRLEEAVRVRHVLRTPVRPQPLETHACSATSAARRSAKSSTLTPRSGSSLPRLFTPTVPCSASSSPTTRMYGTFSSFDRRIRAPSAPCEPSTISARNPSAFSRSTMRNAYASCRSLTGSTTACTGASHAGNAPA